jgi:hypothetical protein
MMENETRVAIAANNNADLYEAVFASHSIKYERTPLGLIAIDPPPPFYANHTILSPDHDELITPPTSGKMVIKDSFCKLDLKHSGFQTLFGATWIWHGGTDPTQTDWQRVETDADLLRWETVWKASGSSTEKRMFNANILANPNIHFLARITDGVITAGCIANQSQDSIGMSNVFATNPSPEIFAQARSAVASINPNTPIVGYESGLDLKFAQGAGFQAIGDLRIVMTKTSAT